MDGDKKMNPIVLYSIVIGALVALAMSIEIIRNLYLDLTKSVVCVMVDTGREHIVRNYRNKQTFITKSSGRQYVVSVPKIQNRRVFYMSDCAEPIKFSMDNVDPAKTLWYCDSNEYYIKMNTSVFEKFNVSKEIKSIQYILYMCAVIAVLAVLIAFKVGAFSFGGGGA